jgi:hypothetical protein
MINLIMKPTRLAMLSLCLLAQVSINQVNTLTSIFNGHIEVVGDMLIADSENPEVIINSVKVGNYPLSGCGEPNCTYNISAIPDGTYVATAYTNTGAFSNTITIRK